MRGLGPPRSGLSAEAAERDAGDVRAAQAGQPGRERDLPDLRRPGRRVEQSFCVPRLIWCREESKPMARMPASFCPDFGIHTLPSIKKAMNLHPICTAVIGSSGNVLRTRRLLIYVYRL